MSMLSRRKYLRGSLIAAGTILTASSTVLAKTCQLTPAQAEGPFYPVQDQHDKDNDLTLVRGSNQHAEGEVITLFGQVTDENCQPVKGALVEIWQACATGKYNHPGDPNPAKLDPNFQYWGRAITNEMGEYEFKTIRPGHYQATNTWIRPAHIHLKVQRRGFNELTTQVYFSDDPHNKNDRILQGLSPSERAKVIVDFTTSKQLLNAEIKRGKFDISISSL